MNVFGIIPARGGSKGIPRKNLVPLGGKPLIAHTIAAAAGSRLLTEWLVSTDDAEIASVSKTWGASVPFLRPESLASDEAPMLPVMQHAVKELERLSGKKPDIIVLLQPACPFRTSDGIDAVVDKLLSTNADSVLTLRDADYSPYLMKRLEGDRVIHLFPEEAKRFTRRQDIPLTYRPAGSVYATRYNVLMEQNLILGKDTRGLVTPFEESINIDSEWDLRLARLILSEREQPVHER